MATLGMMYSARGGLIWGQMRGMLSEVRESTPLGGTEPLGGVDPLTSHNTTTYWLKVLHFFSRRPQYTG